MNFLPPKVTTKDNGDGTQTITTTTYKADGGKVTKRKTEPIKKPHPQHQQLPENANRTNRNSLATVPSLEGVKQVLQEVLGTPHGDNSSFANAVNRAIPGEFTLLASQDDVTQAQEDYFAKEHYGLPDNKMGKAGSVATCALAQMMYENPKKFMANSGAKPYDCRQILHQIKTRVQKSSRLEAKPTITSSRPLGAPALNSNQYAPFYIVPPGFTGKRRALLIGVVAGNGDDLKGPPNDVTNIYHFLVDHCGFKKEDITVLRDDVHTRDHKPSTKKNILDNFDRLVKLSKPKDVCFVQFSGHGGRLGDNLYILPSDFKKNGHILDDDILLDLIKYMPAKVHTTMLVDCCYSGVIGDLPYTLTSNTQDGDPQRIGKYYDTNTRQETIQNEQAPSKEYLAKKEARSKWKNVSRLTSIAATYATEFAKDVEKGSSVFAEQAREIMEKKKAQAAEAAASAATSARQAAASANQHARQAAANANQHIKDRQAAAALRRSSTESDPNNRSTTSGVRSAAPAPSPSKPGLARSTTTPNAHRSTAPRPSPSNKQPGLARSTTIPNAHQARSKSPNAAPFRRTQTHAPAAQQASTSPRAKPEAARPSGRQPLRRVKTATDAPTREHFGRRHKTAEEEAREFEEAARRAAVGRKDVGAERSRPAPAPLRRTKTQEEEAREFEEAARRAAVGRKDVGAERSRPGAQCPSAFEDAAAEREEAARRAAVEQSKREAAAARSAAGGRSKETPRRCKTMQDVAMEREMFARQDAVERSKREAAEARSAREEEVARRAANSADEAARREAVERSKREKEEEAVRRADEAARMEAVERSRREKEEAKDRAGRVKEEEEAARREAAERSRRAKEEEAARRAASEAEDAARREAVERSRREKEEAAAKRAEEAARREAVERSRREKEEALQNK